MTNITAKRHKKTYVLGITGSIGSGKSLVGRQLEEMGVAVIDADHLSHELVNNPGPAYDAIIARFGADIADVPGGPVNRKKLGAIVFSDPQARTDLETILHPAIAALQNTRVAELAKTHDVVAVLVPLLFETGSEGRYSAVWAVTVHKEIQIARLKMRDKMTDEEVMRRIKSQWPQSKKAERADKIVDNSGSPDQTRAQVAQLLGEIMQKMEAGAGVNDAVIADSAADISAASAPAPVTVPVPVPAVEADGTSAADPAADVDANAAPADVDADDAADADAAPTADADAPAVDANARNRNALSQLGAIAVEEALEKLGDTATTSHREATASMTMVVKGKKSDGASGTTNGASKGATDPAGGTANVTDSDNERELEVDVRMAVKNRPGTADPAPVPAPAPVPVPAPPAPTPVPAPVSERTWLVMGIGLLALLAFLAFLGFLTWSHNDKPVVINNTPAATPVVINNNTTAQPPVVVNNTQTTTVKVGTVETVATPPVDGNDSLTVITRPDPCNTCGGVVVDNKPRLAIPLEVLAPGSSTAVVGSETVVTKGSCRSGAEVLSEAPAFAMRTLHNQVRWRVVKWTVISEGDGPTAASCLRTTVEGHDSQGRLVVRQSYGDQLAFIGQFTVNYGNCTAQVDRFNSINQFVGRSLYTFSTSGKLVQATQFDGNQRAVIGLTVQRNRDGSIYAVTYGTTTVNGRIWESQSFAKLGQYRAFLNDQFYLADSVQNAF